MAQGTVLVVEDEELMRTILRRLLEEAGYRVVSADSAENALALIAQADIAVTLTDIKMAGMDGITLLDRIRAADPNAQVIVMTAFSSVDTAVAALRKGAFDYITKPFVNEDLLQSVANAARQRQLAAENRELRRELNKQFAFSEMVGGSEALQQIFRTVQKVAATNASVLIRGETGTGKELVARAIHYNSQRAAGRFVAINCGALPDALLESELFGHKRGSFTGAVADKKGLFLAADGGTIFLDEVGELPHPLQVKLLRALQEHKVRPVGSNVSESFDARVIAATNRDLEAEMASGRFREDLYYRLNVIEIVVPPLRERSEDIPVLTKYFIGRAAGSQNERPKQLSEAASRALSSYSWPGNIRELENAIERAFVMSGDTIEESDLPPHVRDAGRQAVGRESLTLEEVERQHIARVLSSVSYDKAEAAAILGIDLSTLYRKLKRYEEEQASDRVSAP